jgi:hypothetical protein
VVVVVEPPVPQEPKAVLVAVAQVHISLVEAHLLLQLQELQILEAGAVVETLVLTVVMVVLD